MEEDLSTNLTPDFDGGDSTSGESYLHLLAKQNNVSQFKEYIQQIQNLEDNDEKFGLEKDMTNGLLMQVSKMCLLWLEKYFFIILLYLGES